MLTVSHSMVDCCRDRPPLSRFTLPRRG
jgi:hypothetical protein